MSIADVTSRVDAVTNRVAEIQALVQQAIGATTATRAAPAASAADGFATNLQSAQTNQAAQAAALAGSEPISYGAATGLTGAPAAYAARNGATGVTGATGAVGAPTGGSDGGQYAEMIRAAAVRHGIDPQVFVNLVRQESGFDPGAGSSAGAQGLTQLMPGTAASLGVTDPLDPAQSLEGGAKYLRQQLDRFGGDYPKALAAYNAGPGAVERFGGIPPYAETQHYVQTILGTGRTA